MRVDYLHRSSHVLAPASLLHRKMSAMTPMLEIVLGPTAVVSIVGALTLRSLTHSSSATADKQNKLYQDKDGQATMESQQNAEIIFHRRAAYAAAGIVASVIPVLRNASDTSSSSVDAVLWVGSCRTPCCRDRRLTQSSFCSRPKSPALHASRARFKRTGA